MKRLITAFGLLCLAGSLVFPQERFSKKRVEWNRPAKPFHIIGNIYFVGTGGLGCYLITTPQGDILLDGALPESAQQIEQHVAELGFHLKDVKYLLNSHAHFDHAGGLAELKRATGAQMIASRGDAGTLNTGFQSSYGGGWDSHFPAVKVDRVIDSGDKVELGGTVLTAVITPGHTKGCTTWTMPVTEAGKIYNVVFYCSTTVAGYPLVNNRYYPQIVSDYEHSFAVLKKLRCDVFLAGHTEIFNMTGKLARMKAGGPNPFIEPGELTSVVNRSQQKFEEELHRQQRGAKPS